MVSSRGCLIWKFLKWGSPKSSKIIQKATLDHSRTPVLRKPPMTPAARAWPHPELPLQDGIEDLPQLRRGSLSVPDPKTLRGLLLASKSEYVYEDKVI